MTGPFGGTVTAVAVNPKDPKILLAGSRNSLLYASENSGESWRMLPFPKRPFGEVTSILADPSNQSHYFVGLIGSENVGLFETNDGGAAWAPVSAIQNFGVRALTVAPSDPTRFVAGTLKGVFQSTDSGKTWNRISDPDNAEMQGITAVAVDPKDTNIIYAGTTHLPWKTLDGGKTWNSIHTGMIDDSDVFSIYIDPNAPENIYASACSGIYASGNRGEMWRKLLGIPNTHRRTHVIRQDPQQAGTIYAGTTLGLFRSPDKGAKWKQMNQDQVNSLAFDPVAPANMFLGLESAGIWHSENGGLDLKSRNEGFVSRWITDMTTLGKKVYAVDGDGAIFNSEDGEKWERLSSVTGLRGVHLNSLASFADEKSALLASSQYGLYRSADGGATWKALPISITVPVKTPATRTVVRKGRKTVARAVPAKPRTVLKSIKLGAVNRLLAIKSNDGNMIFAATDKGLLMTRDMGLHWTQQDIPEAVEISAVYGNLNSDGQLVATTKTALYFSNDFGQHWKPTSFPIEVKRVTDIAVPSQPNSPILAATLQGLYGTSDQGEKWTTVTGGLPVSTVNSVIYDPGRATVAYAVQYGQLYGTNNSGATWSRLPTALQSLHIRHLWMPGINSDRLYGMTTDLGILFRNQGLIQ